MLRCVPPGQPCCLSAGVLLTEKTLQTPCDRPSLLLFLCMARLDSPTPCPSEGRKPDNSPSKTHLPQTQCEEFNLNTVEEGIGLYEEVAGLHWERTGLREEGVGLHEDEAGLHGEWECLHAERAGLHEEEVDNVSWTTAVG
ncbi:hypothetical protein SKAU_G00166770 [Synaphobranchus kaupii]|uniref:Uncharacterized protein n=1 Tax=Synaphobranchus kaupii TaxID=118154 RepID=A0A9Q1J0F2_SYNKA|nr:hypothetical protein SKAU_G00166770 [Synaphobranchus kaupii]